MIEAFREKVKKGGMKVSVCFPTRFHGYYLADQLQQRGALAYLYTAYFGRLGRRRNDHGVNIPRSQVRTNLLAAGLIYGFNPKDDLFAKKYFGEWVAKNLANEDIVITLGQSSLPILRRVKELGITAILERGSSHVHYQRDILFEEYERWGGPVEDLKGSFSAERTEQELLEYELADYVAIPSSFVERTFLEQYFPQEKLLKNPYGVDLREFRQLPKEDDVFRVVYAGSMSLRKGVHYLLQAWSELKLPDAELWLVGGKLPEIEPFLEQYTGSYRYFGHQPQAELHKLYSKCCVFAMCSIEEGMAMVQLQGMSCGLPLLCTPNTGGDDLVEEGKEGFIVPIRDVETLKERFLYLYEHRDICYEMGQAAKQKVQQGFTWNDYGERAVKKYMELVDNGGYRPYLT